MTDEIKEPEVKEEEFAVNAEVTIFDPRYIKRGNTYRREYPELDRIIEFQNIHDNDLKFVWWFSNPTSPLVLNETIPMKRAARAYRRVFGDNHYDGKKKFNFCQLMFPEPIKMAVEKMASFDNDTRYRAKVMVDKTFSDCEEISKLNPDAFVTELYDKEGKKTKSEIDYVKFLSVKKTALSMLPDLLKIKEEGFAVKVNGKVDDEKTGQKNIAQFLKDKKNET